MVHKLETRFKIYFNWFVDTLDMVNAKTFSNSVISVRLRKLEKQYAGLLDAYENALNGITEAGVVDQIQNNFKQAEQIYNQLEAVSAGFPDLSSKHVPTESAQTTRLPRIDLVRFNGDVFSWTSFISLFTSLVLTRQDISKTEKFHYLFSHVEKEPRSLLQHLPMVDGSLDTALDILRSRYENTRLIADCHISRILNLPVLNKAVGLRERVLNPLLESSRALKNLGFPVEQWSYMLLYISLSKLPVDLRTRFEQKYGGNNINLPTFDQLIEFLQNECRLLDTAVGESVSYAEKVRSGPRNPKNVHTAEVVQLNNLAEGGSKRLTEDNSHGNERRHCVFCNRPGHLIDYCYKFIKLNKFDRKEWVNFSGLCYKCYGKHSASFCNRNVTCDSCGNSGHDKLICLWKGDRHVESPRRHGGSSPRHTAQRGESGRSPPTSPRVSYHGGAGAGSRSGRPAANRFDERRQVHGHTYHCNNIMRIDRSDSEHNYNMRDARDYTRGQENRQDIRYQFGNCNNGNYGNGNGNVTYASKIIRKSQSPVARDNNTRSQ